MKRFLLFSYEEYECRGGWADFDGSFDTAEEARARADEMSKAEHSRLNAHVVDSQTGKVVLRLDRHVVGKTWRDWEYRWAS